ncbi:MAG: hypothetical protein ABI634_08590 [Acidobacteriota bacterium]
MRRSTTRVVLIVGAVVSLALMYRAGHRNPSVLLMAMFAIWVAAPFAAMGFAGRAVRRWPSQSQTWVDRATLAVVLGSVGTYVVDAATPISPKAAFIYLVVPLVSWIVLAIVGAVALSKSRR